MFIADISIGSDGSVAGGCDQVMRLSLPLNPAVKSNHTCTLSCTEHTLILYQPVKNKAQDRQCTTTVYSVGAEPD